MTAPQYGQPQPPEYARNYPPERYQPEFTNNTFEPAPQNDAAIQYGFRPGGPGPDRTTLPGRAVMSGAASFWYVLGCIGFGAMYFAKVPAKKALSEAGLATMTSAERFWYVLQCIAFGAGYFAKLPVKKALTEMH
jgi:hypothetical protein